MRGCSRRKGCGDRGGGECNILPQNIICCRNMFLRCRKIYRGPLVTVCHKHRHALRNSYVWHSEQPLRGSALRLRYVVILYTYPTNEGLVIRYVYEMTEFRRCWDLIHAGVVTRRPCIAALLQRCCSPAVSPNEWLYMFIYLRICKWGFYRNVIPMR